MNVQKRDWWNEHVPWKQNGSEVCVIEIVIQVVAWTAKQHLILLKYHDAVFYDKC